MTPVNLVSPGVVDMREFCKELGSAMRRPSWAPVPPFALRLILGEMAGMILGGMVMMFRQQQEASGARGAGARRMAQWFAQ